MTQLQATRLAVRIQEAIFKRALRSIRVGVSERDLARVIRQEANARGARRFAFPPIVSFGRNAAQIHHRPGRRRLRVGDLIMLDYGVKVSGWCSDLTRMVFFGRPTLAIARLYQRLLAAQEQAIRAVRAGAPTSFAAAAAYRPFLSRRTECRLLRHAIGHGVGKRIHVKPNLRLLSRETFEAGQIVTVEPGLYDPAWGGLRIEDMVLVKRGAPEVLTARIPKRLTVVPTA